MPNLPKLVRDRLAGAPAGIANQHPDADLLTAFVEGAVTARERDQLLSHLAICGECREITALAAPEAVPDRQLVAVVSAPRKWWNLSMLRWAAVSATAVVVLAVGLMVRSPQKQLRITSDAGAGSGDVTASLDTSAAMRTSRDRDKLPPEESAPADQKSGARREVAPTLADKLETKQLPATPTGIVAPANADTVARNAPTPAAPAMAKKAAVPSAATAMQAGAAYQSGATPGRGDANVAQLATSDTVTVAASAPAISAKAASDLDAAKLHERAKSATTQVALNKEKAVNEEKKDEMRLADANKVEPGTSSESAAQKPAGAANEASRVVARGAFGPTARPAVELMAAPTSIPPAKAVPVRWTIDAAGQLQRSTDLGKSWQIISVDDGIHLQSLAVLEAQLWAGGTGGALYHSVDSGNSWTRVRPVEGQITLNDDITRISLPDAQHVTVTTASSVWVSADGGQTWRKQ